MDSHEKDIDGDITNSTVWEAITEDIPVLFDYCNSILEKHRVLERSAVQVDLDSMKRDK